MTTDSEYKGTTIGFLSGGETEPLRLSGRMVEVPFGDTLYILGPMDQFEVWGGELMVREVRADGLGVFSAVRRLA